MPCATCRSIRRGRDWPSGRRTGAGQARADLAWEDDELVRVAPALDRYGRFADFLEAPADYALAWRALRQSETTGRPLGHAGWLAELEARTGRTLAA